MHYTYVLLSMKDRKFYGGYTTDLQKRLAEHNLGKVASTKQRRPLRVIYYEACGNKQDALRWERYLKTTWGKRYLKNRLTEFLKSNELPRRKQRGIKNFKFCHSALDAESSPVFWIPAGVYPVLDTGPE